MALNKEMHKLKRYDHAAEYNTAAVLCLQHGVSRLYAAA